jgi:hypothetical protein
MKMNFKCKEMIFDNKKEAIDHLHNLKTEDYKVEPDKLHVINDGKSFYLEMFDKTVSQFPMRESFLLKLLKWFSFPTHQLKILDIDTITSLLNDYLLAINNRYVHVKCENGDALSITSDRFTDVKDIELLRRLDSETIDMIYMSDFETNIRTKSKFKIMPFPDDEFGVGLNITNSETGFKSFQISNYLLRYVCSNGAYVRDMVDEVKYSHYDLFLQDVFSILELKVKTADKQSKIIESKIKLLDQVIPMDKITEVNKDIQKRLGIKLLNDIIESDRVLTKYELFNLITHRAKEYRQFQRIRIEEIAGRMIYTLSENLQKS